MRGINGGINGLPCLPLPLFFFFFLCFSVSLPRYMLSSASIFFHPAFMHIHQFNVFSRHGHKVYSFNSLRVMKPLPLFLLSSALFSHSSDLYISLSFNANSRYFPLFLFSIPTSLISKVFPLPLLFPSSLSLPPFLNPQYGPFPSQTLSSPSSHYPIASVYRLKHHMPKRSGKIS